MFIFDRQMIIEITMGADLTLYENYGLQVILYNYSYATSLKIGV